MDSVQELMEGVGMAQVEGTAPSVAAPAPVAPPRRTKMVFVYSDEDEVEGLAKGGTVNGMAEVACETQAIPLSEDALAELRADAHAIDAERSEPSDGGSDGGVHDGVGGFFFQEDVLSGLGAVATAPGLTSSSSSSNGVRVRTVDAPALWEGALAPPSTAHDGDDGVAEMPALLRRGLPAATFVLESRRKRFRDPDGETAPTSTVAAAVASSAVSAGEPASSAVEGDVDEEEVEEDFDVKPVFEEDGKTVCALQTRGGYRLTLDERDLLENADGEDGGEEPEEVGAAEVVDGAAQQPGTGEEEEDGVEVISSEPALGNEEDAQEDWGDFPDDEDEDDEEEDEIDEAIVVAVVEQLVRCCEADDVDPQLSIEVGRFTASAKPLLKELTDGAISPKEFGQRIDRDLRRFQRIYRVVYRPRDSPIIIDGVKMDM